MSILQEQAVKLISGLSDDNVGFLIEVIQRLMSQKVYTDTVQDIGASKRIQAFQRLNEVRAEITKYLPENFDPDKELEEARAERYGSVD
ncbi:MAG: hypothetical protein NC548_35975 [Lachnospiraceae bacterium]|nr:hypothetical protein [Lachnospiraceae bacterium]